MIPEEKDGGVEGRLEGTLRGLLRPLSELELDLLDTIWTKMYHAAMAWAVGDKGDEPEEIWPPWGSVSHDFWTRNRPSSAHEILEELPSLPAPAGHLMQPYGLVWRQDWLSTDRPKPDERVGLTIAGLHRLALSGRRRPSLPESLVRAINGIALASVERANRGEYSPVSVPLERYAGFIVPMDSDRPYPMPLSGIGALLQKESYVALNAFQNSGQWAVTLDVESLRDYLEVTTADQYIDHISRAARQGRTKQDNMEARVQPTGSEIFIVHGHDEALKYEVARFLEKWVENKVTILHEQTDQGRTTTEKFEEHASRAAYAVVLLTPDDQGGKVDGELNLRARQNVVLELGYFFGKLGRRRVAAIMKGDVERPSDVAGFLYVDHQDQWQTKLLDELREIDEIQWKAR